MSPPEVLKQPGGPDGPLEREPSQDGDLRLARVRYWPDELEVEIIDDGRGATALSGTSPGGLGLIGMRERAALHGGQLTAGPAAGGGFAVRVKLPTSDGVL
jgi:glucose-6-phosphate-specific signal transduction histidine kinase